MPYQVAIASLRGKITRYKIVLATLEQLQAEGPAETHPEVTEAEKAAVLSYPAPLIAPAGELKKKKVLEEAESGNKKDQIVDYIRQHGPCQAKEIASNLSMSRSAAGWNLRILKKEKAVEMIGAASNSLWRIPQKSVKSNPAPAEPQKPVKTAPPPDDYYCAKCHCKFAAEPAFKSHMESYHQEV